MYILRKPFLDTLSFLNPWKTDPCINLFLHIVQDLVITVRQNTQAFFFKLFQIIYNLAAKNVEPFSKLGS